MKLKQIKEEIQTLARRIGGMLKTSARNPWRLYERARSKRGAPEKWFVKYAAAELVRADQYLRDALKLTGQAAEQLLANAEICLGRARAQLTLREAL